MEPWILIALEKDKLTEYLKLNSWYIKELYRHPENYPRIKKELKEKHNLRFRDKVSNVVDDIELVTSILSTMN